MPSLVKSVSLQLGLISCTVSLDSAVEKKASLTQLCVNGHPPRKITMPTVCPECGPVERATLKRGSAVGKDAFVVVETAEIANLNDAEAFKGKIALTPHPAADVRESTVPGEKAYWLTPQGDPGNYLLLAQVLADSPDVAYCAMYTVRSVAAMFELNVRSGALLLSERVQGAKIRTAPEVTGSYNPDLLPLAEQFAQAQLKPFDPETYKDTYAERLSGLLAGRDPVSVSMTLAASAPEPTALLDALTAALKPTKSARKPRKKAA